MKLLLVNVCVILCVDLVLGSPIRFGTTYNERPERFCGSKLSVEMAIICQGKYNSDFRSLINNHKTKRGIVDECCSSPCSRKYLKENYCGVLPVTSTTTNISTTTVEVTTEPAIKIMPVDYSLYYNALIARVLAEYPKDFPIH